MDLFFGSCRHVKYLRTKQVDGEIALSATIYAKITALFVVLTLLLMAIGYVVGLYFGDPLTFMLLALGLAAVLNIATYYYSDSIVVKMSRAKVIQESDNPTLFKIVRDVADKAGIPMPRVGIVESPQPNAFATGRGPDRAVVCATSSILQTLTPSELEAVIGHEIGHVVHRDVLMSSIAATMAGAISYIGTLAMWSVWFGGGGRNRNGGSPIFLLAAAILIPLGASFVQLGISRNDEYSADEYGAKLTRDPGALINALGKISDRVHTGSFSKRGTPSPSPATGSLWIVNPFRGRAMMELFSTHPSLPHRVERLKKVAREMNLYVP
jgi:heat shock protein HtpX